MLTNRNQLPVPEAVAVPDFEAKLAEFKSTLIGRIDKEDPALAREVEKTLAKEGELMTKMAEASTVMVLTEIRARNQQFLSRLAGHAKGADLDNVVADHGIERQVIDPGDPSAFPPVPPVMESDDDLLLRYWLAPHMPAAGSRLQYQAVGLMLDEVPVITLDKPQENQVRLTYTFEPDGFVAKIKDVRGRQTAPGHVRVPVLAIADGVTSDELLAKVAAVYARDNVKPETDEVEVVAAGFLDWQADVICWIHEGPDTEVLKAAMETQLAKYAEEVRVLGGKAKRSKIDQIMHNAGAAELQINQPAADVAADWDVAPRNTGIQVEVRVL